MLVGGGADEAPEVYKRLPEVLAAHGDSIRVTHTLRPVGVARAGRDVHRPLDKDSRAARAAHLVPAWPAPAGLQPAAAAHRRRMQQEWDCADPNAARTATKATRASRRGCERRGLVNDASGGVHGATASPEHEEGGVAYEGNAPSGKSCTRASSRRCRRVAEPTARRQPARPSHPRGASFRQWAPREPRVATVVLVTAERAGTVPAASAVACRGQNSRASDRAASDAPRSSP